MLFFQLKKKRYIYTASTSKSTETIKATVQSPRLHDLSDNTTVNAIAPYTYGDNDYRYFGARSFNNGDGKTL